MHPVKLAAETPIDILTKDVPSVASDYGWLIGVVVGAALLFIAIGIARRLLTLKRRKQAKPDQQFTEVLGSYPPPPAQWGERRLTLHGLPVRMRLVVVAPLGTEAGQLEPEQMEAILEQLMPGLGGFVRLDKPRLRTWPTQLSLQGFLASFRRHAFRPDPEAAVSRWILLMGKAMFDRRPIVLGFAFLADHDNTLNRVILDHAHQWMEVLRVAERPR